MLVLELANWDVENHLYYCWGYSWEEILSFYKRKKKIHYDEKSADYEFLMKLAQACLGSGNSSDKGVGMDTGEGLEEITDAQEADMREMLGEDYDKVYG